MIMVYKMDRIFTWLLLAVLTTGLMPRQVANAPRLYARGVVLVGLGQAGKSSAFARLEKALQAQVVGELPQVTRLCCKFRLDRKNRLSCLPSSNRVWHLPSWIMPFRWTELLKDDSHSKGNKTIKLQHSQKPGTRPIPGSKRPLLFQAMVV